MESQDCTRLFAAWGEFIFHRVLTVPVESYTTKVTWRLPIQPVIGQPQRAQWVGRGDDLLSIKGKLFPDSEIGRPSSLAILEAQADTGIAQYLILLPQNRVLGLYFLENARYVHSSLLGSLAFEIEFTAQFRKQP